MKFASSKNLFRVVLISAFTTVIFAFGNPKEAQEVTSLRLKYYTSTKRTDIPLQNEPIRLTIEGQNFEGKTNRRGNVLFKRIPCDNEASVYVGGKPQAVFKRYIKCGVKTEWIYYFNPFEPPEGKIEQQK